MYPFIPAFDLTEPAIETLQALVSETPAFEFSLARVREFEGGIVYLEPQPSAPFVRLSKEIGREFGLLPFAGAFGEEAVAHLTVAILESDSERSRVIDQLLPALPITIRAEEAWLMVGTKSTSWMVVRKMRLCG